MEQLICAWKDIFDNVTEDGEISFSEWVGERVPMGPAESVQSIVRIVMKYQEFV